jgi:hypothetical protein
MTGTAQQTCRVEYRRNEIVVRGPGEDAKREAHRIVRRFACSATPYRVESQESDRVILRPE